ncbi:hypothetical protein [Halobacillus seohaensis]
MRLSRSSSRNNLTPKENDNDVIEFIENVEKPNKREDAYQLVDI